MKPRARRIALLTVAAGCLVVAGLVVLNWSTVRDHGEAWCFQATHETVTLRSGSIEPVYLGAWKFRNLADRYSTAVVLDPEMITEGGASDSTIDVLREYGYRIIEQRFPRRAYVVTGHPALSDIQYICTMKRRGLRVTLTAGAIGLAVVAAVVAFNWGVVRDHVEAWRFMRTRKTIEMVPGRPISYASDVDNLFQRIANRCELPLIYESAARSRRIGAEWDGTSVDAVLSALREEGYRIVELRLPCHAYVIVDFPEAETFRSVEAMLGGPPANAK